MRWRWPRICRRDSPKAFQAPQLDMQPFDDAAVQKQQLALAGKHAELSQSMKEAERAKREENPSSPVLQKSAG